MTKMQDLERRKIADQQRIEQVENKKQKQQELLLIKQTEQRVNQDLDLILEAVEKSN